LKGGKEKRKKERKGEKREGKKRKRERKRTKIQFESISGVFAHFPWDE